MFLDRLELNAKNLEVLNLNTDEFIKEINWVDLKANEYEIHIWSNGNYLGRERYKGNIILVYKGE